MHLLKRNLSILGLALLATIFNVVQAKDEAAQVSSRWDDVRQALFNDASIELGKDVIQLDAPQRAYDAAIVPIKINVTLPEGKTLDKLYLIVDENPAPLAGTFTFKKQSSNVEMQTRIRINEYTNVRSIAKTNDGQYFMDEVFVKAAGGCSAPMLSDQAAALARVGKLKFKIGESSEKLPQSKIGHVLVSHPNNSGMQFDQVSRNFIPAYFINRISVKLDDEELFVLDTNFSLSENPSVHFSFDSQDYSKSKISVEAIDTKDGKFEKTWPVEG